MKRFLMLLLLAGVCVLPIGCGSKATTPTSSSGGGSAAFTYPLIANFGQWWYDNESNWSEFCGEYYPLPGEFSYMTGIATNGTYVFVGDGDYGDIQVFDTLGNFITWFFPADASGETGEPYGLTTDNAGHLYEADPDEEVINQFNITDILAQALSAPQTEYCDFINTVNANASYEGDDCPLDVAVDGSGNMYVADPCENEIYKIAPNLDETDPNWGDDWVAETKNAASTVNGGLLEGPTGIAVDSSGTHVYVAENDDAANLIQIYTNGLVTVGFIGNSTGAPSTVAGQFDEPFEVRMDNQGNLMVSDNDNARVQRLTTSGSVLNIIGWYASTTTPISADLYSPLGLVVDPNNNLYVADNNMASVFKYAP